MTKDEIIQALAERKIVCWGNPHYQLRYRQTQFWVVHISGAMSHLPATDKNLGECYVQVQSN